MSGFHALVSSGTTPKFLDHESDVRLVGYGAMLMESFVAVMALIVASVLTPAVYFAVNAAAAVTGPTHEAVGATITGWGFPLAASRHLHEAMRLRERITDPEALAEIERQFGGIF